MTLPTTNDSRRFRRVAVRILIDYVSDKDMCCHYATTLGAGGLFVETDDPPEIGRSLKMRFHLPEGVTRPVSKTLRSQEQMEEHDPATVHQLTLDAFWKKPEQTNTS